MADVHVKGLDQLYGLLQQIPVKLEKNVMRGALREGAKVLLAEAAYRAPARSGALVSSLKIGTRARGGTVSSYVKSNLFYARFVEFGTRAHEIKPRQAKSLLIAGWFGLVVKHPGARPRPFLRPALDGGANAAVVATAEYIKRRLASKEGIDTAYVMIEGDEA